ncbi:MAG TPA: DMT family transporter [Verrucomicrobiae bacterium]|nr:DMT family transporter [Verrucomicrobiae bacterium]
MGILLGLLTALSWGSSDLLARFATRKIGTLSAMLYMQSIGFLLLTLALPSLGGLGHLADGSGWTPWAWGIVAGVINTFATLAMYRSFEIGKLSVVAPVSASYPALTMLLAAATGEHLGPLRFMGLVLILLGVVIVARGEEVPGDANPLDEKTYPGKRHLGVGWALLSALGFGFLFWILGTRAIPAVGSAQTVWLVRLTSAALTAVVILFWRQPISVPRADAKWLVLGMGILDTSAYVLNSYGLRLEQVSVVTVLSSLYGAVTVGLAAALLKEKISRVQLAGVVAIFVGIASITW